MKSFLGFVAYLLGCLLLSALLLPLSHPLLAAVAGEDATPARVLYRVAMLLMLIGFPWFLRRQRLLGWHLIGFTLPRRAAWAAVLRGLLIGIAMLALLIAALVAVGARAWSPPRDFSAAGLLEVLLAGLIGGLLVGLVEEVFFRGMMHTALRRTLAFWPTALLTGGFYAAVHFIAPEAPAPGVPLDTATALGMVWTGLANLADFARIHDSLAALLVAGVLLSMVRERTGSILWVIGIHAGWVLVIKLAKYLTVTDMSGGFPFWIGHYDRVTGELAALWLAALAAVYWFAGARRRSSPRPRGDGLPG